MNTCDIKVSFARAIEDSYDGFTSRQFLGKGKLVLGPVIKYLRLMGARPDLRFSTTHVHCKEIEELEDDMKVVIKLQRTSRLERKKHKIEKRCAKLIRKGIRKHFHDEKYVDVTLKFV